MGRNRDLAKKLYFIERLDRNGLRQSRVDTIGERPQHHVGCQDSSREYESELHGADWTLPAARNKTKVDLVRPLSKAARAVLPKRRGKFVFSSDDGKTCFSGFSKGKTRLDRESGVKGWTPHDLRRTARTLMSRAGVNSDHAELCLGHVLTGVRGTYDRHAYHAEKAVAFDKLAGLVAQIAGPAAFRVNESNESRSGSKTL